ncbi:MAG: 50S ribosomal protein L15 [Phycisphaerales bacterium]
MMIHEITALAGKYKQRKRVGRGRASGVGKTSGRGHKGAGSRSGFSARHQFEGGQMPFFRRMSKRGFTNVNFTVPFWTVNLRDLLDHPEFAKGGEVTKERLAETGLIRGDDRAVKILGDLGNREKVGVKFSVKVERVTDSARKHITDAGGSVEEIGTRRDIVRGVDRNSDDRAPKNLGKKLKRTSPGSKKKK